MQLQRCEPQQNYRETFLFLPPNNFFLLNTLFQRHTLFDVLKVELVCLYICRQLSVFPKNSIRIYPIKLKIDMLYYMNNTFQNTIL